MRKIDDGSAHQGTENATVADRESTTSHVLNGKLSISGLGTGSVSLYKIEWVLVYLLAELRNGFLDAYQVHRFRVSHHRCD